MSEREKLWKKLDENDRKFMWFYRKYMPDAELHYNTLYQQAKGDILTKMSEELKEAISEYLSEN